MKQNRKMSYFHSKISMFFICEKSVNNVIRETLFREILPLILSKLSGLMNLYLPWNHQKPWFSDNFRVDRSYLIHLISFILEVKFAKDPEIENMPYVECFCEWLLKC